MCNIILKLQTYLIPLQLNTGVNGFANETFTFVGTDLLISVSNFMGEVILIYCCWLLWSKIGLLTGDLWVRPSKYGLATAPAVPHMAELSWSLIQYGRNRTIPVHFAVVRNS